MKPKARKWAGETFDAFVAIHKEDDSIVEENSDRRPNLYKTATYANGIAWRAFPVTVTIKPRKAKRAKGGGK